MQRIIKLILSLKERQSRNFKKPDYETYHFSTSECVLYTAEGCLVISVIAYVFYRSFYALPVLAPFLLLFLREKRSQQIKRTKNNLNQQFRDAVLAVSSALKSGRSVENAFCEALKDMRQLHGKEAVIVTELSLIERGLTMNVTLEALLYDLAERSGLEDIRNFAEVFYVAKRTGGNLPSIIQKTANNIHDKIEVKKEIETFIFARQYEQRVMNLIPFLIVLYVSFTSPGFLDAMYGNAAGIVVMSCCLAVYGAAYKMAGHIVDIKV